MSFRRALAGFLVLAFIFVSLATFFIFAVSNTFFRPSFYEEDIQQPTYDFLVNFTVKSLREDDEFLAARFTETDLRREVTTVFPPALFQKLSKDFSEQMQTWREDPNKPLTLSLSVFRESLLTLAHNLSFQLFEALPECRDAEVPAVGEDGLPTCVPPGAEYNVVAAPFSEKFEKTIYAAIPEQIQIDLNNSLGEDGPLLSQWFVIMDMVKFVSYGLLLGLIALIALLVYKPFTSVMLYEGVAFLVSGILGIATGFALSAAPVVFGQTITSPQLEADVRHFMSAVVSLFSIEMQKAAVVFLGLGTCMLLVRVFLKHRS